MAIAAANPVTTRPLSKRHRMDLVDTVLVSVHLEFQASQEALDLRDQQVLRDHPAIMDLKAHEATRAMKALVEDKVSRVLRELKVPWVQLVQLGRRGMQVLVEVKVLQASRVHQATWFVTGNNALLRILMTERTVD